VGNSKGEMWIATDGGYVVKYLLTTTGKDDLFGDGVEGVLTWDYELTGINQPVAIALPAGCPAVLADVPALPDATAVVNGPGDLSFDTATGITDVVAFYTGKLPPLGWTATVDPAVDDTGASLEFSKGDQTVSIDISTANGTTSVDVTEFPTN